MRKDILKKENNYYTIQKKSVILPSDKQKSAYEWKGLEQPNKNTNALNT